MDGVVKEVGLPEMCMRDSLMLHLHYPRPHICQVSQTDIYYSPINNNGSALGEKKTRGTLFSS